MPSARTTFARFGRSALVLLLALVVGSAFAQRTEVEFWHGFTGALGETLERYVDDFNQSQPDFTVNPSYKGSYPDTMVAAIAAYRSGTAPDIVQMYEVGTGAFIYSGRGHPGAPADGRHRGAVRSRHLRAGGQGLLQPRRRFDDGVPVQQLHRRDVGQRRRPDGGRHRSHHRRTRDLGAGPRVAMQVVDAGAANCGFSMAWPTWTQYEQFSAIHDVPYATLANGFEGLGAELLINSPLHVQHLQNLIDMQAEGSFMYGGRGNAGDTNFVTGECAIVHGSSALYGRVSREVEFNWTVHPLPYYEGTPGAPINSIIGGAAFWVIDGGQSPEKLRGIAEMFAFMSTVEETEWWHKTTGYLPIRVGIFEKLQEEGFYLENPAFGLPYLQLTRTEPTENSRGFRLGGMPAIRDIIEEEVEIALGGGQTAQQALDNAVARGNQVLRTFERQHR
jgi:sn-glycerol 3-phosphate transport system substrate-binding protein